MYEAHKLHLGTYSHIEYINHHFKALCIKYRCWKYCPIGINPCFMKCIYKYLLIVKYHTSMWQKERSTRHGSTTTMFTSGHFTIYFPIRGTIQNITNIHMTPTWYLLHRKKKTTIENSNNSERFKWGGLSAEEVQLSNYAKKSKNPSISEVPIHVCVGISHSYKCISSLQKQEISMEMRARSVGRWFTSSVPLVEFNCIWWKPEDREKGGPDSLNITMMIFLVWHV